MAYVVNKTNGNIVAVVEDGTVDTISSSIALVGKGTQNYGEYIAENQIVMLENFSNETSPPYPLEGQLWYDSSVSFIKVFDGSTWTSPVTDAYYTSDADSSGTGAITITNNSGITVGASSTAQLAFESGNAVLKTNGSVNAFTINPATGAVTVLADPTADLGIVTKQYVDTLESFGPDADNKATIGTNSFALVLDTETMISADNTGVTLGGASYVSNTPSAETNDLQIASTAFVQNNKASPAFTGIPTAPTATTTDNSIQLATTAFVQNNKVSPAFSGIPTAPTASASTNTTQIATTAFTTNAVSTLSTYASTTYAPKASPTFTGTPAAPSASVGTNTTQIATTAFVQSQLAADKVSPAFTGTPTAPTAAAGTSTTQIASTQYVMTATEKWAGSRKFVSTVDPTAGDGSDGDFWFKIA